jgi:type II secretory pathway component PulJ
VSNVPRVAWIVLLFGPLLTLLGGCTSDDRVVAVAREAADRQAQQNAHMAETVRAETEAHQEMARLQRDLQAHQAEMGRQRDVLEAERREIAKQRQRESLLVPMMEDFGLLLALVLLLGFCWSLLIGLRREGEPKHTTVANELLLQELILEQPEALPNAGPPTAIAPPPIAQDVNQSGCLLS